MTDDEKASVEAAVSALKEKLGDESADALAAIASEGAVPLNYNHFKLPLMENLVRRAMRG